MKLEGIHHITAITADAQENIDFYAGVLGLRLVKKTVNQDDPSVYHLFFADERGSAGSDLTFFEFPGAPRGRAGDGMVHEIAWRVASEEALDFWAERLAARDTESKRGDGTLVFADPEGLQHVLRVSHVEDEPLIAEHPEVPAELRAARLRRGPRLLVRAVAKRGPAPRARVRARRGPLQRGRLGGARLIARRHDRLRPAAVRAGPPGRRHRPPRGLGLDRWTSTRPGGIAPPPAARTRPR